ncbi:MAG: FUSC family protein [Bradyrhizobium sp.]|nr:FUSC family protein [Bradyrhizobium sp.]
MNKGFGVREVIFSLNCFIAAMLALWIAFRLDLRNPWWAMVTVYLTSQPLLSGALRARAVHRVLGTLLGAIATVVIVPNLADSPELTTAAISLWVAFCLYVSLLDRTPRAYALAASGYTAALIGFASVLNPEAVFDTAIARTEETISGTVCAAVVHSLIFPRSVLSVFLAKQAAVLANARRWIAEGLTRELAATVEQEQRGIAADITELAILGSSLPYDTAFQRPSQTVIRALDERLIGFLPLVSTIEDRIAYLRRDGTLP